MNSFSHIADDGHVRMVDVTEKKITHRVAVAQGFIKMEPATFQMILDNTVTKGNVFETARIAGIMAAKNTSFLIPMCHPVCITFVSIEFLPDRMTSTVKIISKVRILAQTGVEMEALTAVSVAALTIYDMCKARDRSMTIFGICLLEKSGGKSGKYISPHFS